MIILSIIYPFLVNQAYPPPNFHQSLVATSPSELQNEISPSGNIHLLIPLLYSLLQVFFSLCAKASTTYSTLNGFYGKPVNLISSLKATLVSFLPLLATNLVLQLIFGLIIFAFIALAFLAHNGLSSIGFAMDYDSGYFLAFVILLVTLLVLAILYLQVKWCLSMVVVVAESKWGLQPLKRSSYLAKGMKGMVLSIFLVLGTPSVLLAFGFYRVITSISAGGISWSIVALAVACTVVALMLELYNMAANAVLFAYCKAWHREVAWEADEELGMGYARLSGYEGKASYAVSGV